MKMAFARGMTPTVLIFLAASVAAVHGKQCTTEEGCREYLSCKRDGTIYCCPGGERLAFNRASGVCNCDTRSSGFSCSGGESFGQGSQLLKSKAGRWDCTSGTTCSRNGNSCTVGSTSYCCPGGHVTTVSHGRKLTSCSCRYDKEGYSCSTYSSSSVTSASALTCAMASFVLLAGNMAYK